MASDYRVTVDNRGRYKHWSLKRSVSPFMLAEVFYVWSFRARLWRLILGN